MADDNDIYKMTGCLSSCQKSTFEIELSQQNENRLDDSKDSALQLTTIVPLSRYELREQVFNLNFAKILQNLTHWILILHSIWSMTGTASSQMSGDTLDYFLVKAAWECTI